MSSISVNIQPLFCGSKRGQEKASSSKRPPLSRQRRRLSPPHRKGAGLNIADDELSVANESLQQEIRNLRQENETLQELNQKLTGQNEELRAFARTLAHNLKTPVNIVVGMAEVLKRESQFSAVAADDRANTDECVAMIIRNGHWANDIIESILLLAQGDRQEVKTAPLDMAGIVREAQARLAPMIGASQAQIVTPEEWPLAMGYGPWIQEVWTNYLSNAIKYGGQPPQIEIGATPEADRSIRFWVKDNGSGLTLEEQQKLFTPFTRLADKGVEGTGLGLSIVKGIVTRLGGQVGLESWPGQGSIFYFTLPVCALDESVSRE